MELFEINVNGRWYFSFPRFGEFSFLWPGQGQHRCAPRLPKTTVEGIFHDDIQSDQLDEKPIWYGSYGNPKVFYCLWAEQFDRAVLWWNVEEKQLLLDFWIQPCGNTLRCWIRPCAFSFLSQQHIFVRKASLHSPPLRQNTETRLMLNQTWDWSWPRLSQISQDYVHRHRHIPLIRCKLICWPALNNLLHVMFQSSSVSSIGTLVKAGLKYCVLLVPHLKMVTVTTTKILMCCS